jgi:hypothetical protein
MFERANERTLVDGCLRERMREPWWTDVEKESGRGPSREKVRGPLDSLQSGPHYIIVVIFDSSGAFVHNQIILIH